MRDPWDDFEELPGEEGIVEAWPGVDAIVVVYDEHGNPVVLDAESLAFGEESVAFGEETFWGSDDLEGWDEPEDEPDEGPDDGPGGAGVREPRRPPPGGPSTAAEADPDESA